MLLIELTYKRMDIVHIRAAIHFGTWEHMLLPPDLFFKMSKKFWTKFGSYTNILYVHTNFCENLRFFVACVEKKKMIREKPFEHRILNFLHMTQKLSVFDQTTLWTHKMTRYTWEKNYWNFLTFQRRLEHILKTDIICSRVPKHPTHISYFM